MPQIDIWLVAHLMLRRYDDNAEPQSARQVDELIAYSDHARVAIWRRQSGGS
jgi:hypothetical protein